MLCLIKYYNVFETEYKNWAFYNLLNKYKSLNILIKRLRVFFTISKIESQIYIKKCMTGSNTL